MGCTRASSTLLMVVVAISVLALDHSVANARQVRSPSMSTGEHHPSRKEALQATTTKENGAVHTGGGAGTVHMSPGSTGEAGVVGQPILGGRGENSSPAAAEKVAVVVARYGPRPHPKKHN
ncbi:hypothetical protein Zm00014a_033435 [Zea mays]|uniref:Uncharacterized protein n=1 Tax=Zea mays TaxID=4577 RepID=A0A3L6EGR1_MAIZE|nr:hypothetical protein Zm00014a_033435 [Zea mays]